MNKYTETSNATYVSTNTLKESDLYIIIFGVFVSVILIMIPCLIGKNGKIKSREWFVSHK